MRTSATKHEQHAPCGPIHLTPDQARAVSGGSGIPILIKEEGQPLRIERIYHPYLPTFPIKDLGSSPY